MNAQRIGRTPSKQYMAMLDIKAIVRKWQDLELSDYQALLAIDKISVALQRIEWDEAHDI